MTPLISFRSFAARIHALIRDERGATAVLFAILIPTMIGIVGLGVETGLWFGDKRQLQTIADAAAVSGGYQLLGGTTTPAAAGTQMAVNLGFSGTVSCAGPVAGDAICIRSPPQAGPFVGDPNAVEAILTSPKVSLLSGMFLPAGLNVVARATAKVFTFQNVCALALSSNTEDILFQQASTTLSMPNCILASNSVFGVSIGLLSNTNLNAYTVYSVGGIRPFSVSAASPLTQVPITFAGASVGDPYSTLPITGATPSSCQPPVPSTSATLSPGTYCNGMSFAAGANYTLNPGTYYVYNGDFSIINANTNVSGAGVTIILTGTPASSIGRINIAAGSGTVSLSAPTSDPTYSGILFYQDPTALSNNVTSCTVPVAGGPNADCLRGGASMTLVGAIYTRSGNVDYNGNTSTSMTCTVIVANTIQFEGASVLDDSNCGAAGLSNFPIVQYVVVAE